MGTGREWSMSQIWATEGACFSRRVGCWMWLLPCGMWAWFCHTGYFFFKLKNCLFVCFNKSMSRYGQEHGGCFIWLSGGISGSLTQRSGWCRGWGSFGPHGSLGWELGCSCLLRGPLSPSREQPQSSRSLRNWPSLSWGHQQ